MATAPRPVVPGVTYHVVSRCVGRTFRLLPTKEVNSIVWYCLAVAAQRTGVDVHEFCFMSNHVHLMVTDVRGELPSFVNRLNSLLSRCLNAHRGWRGSNFERNYARVKELTTAAAINTCAYILSNPCAADLVTKGSGWRGVTSVRMRYGETREIEKPEVGVWKYLRRCRVSEKGRRRKRGVAPGRKRRLDRSKLPDVVELELKPLPLEFDGSSEEMRDAILAQLRVMEVEAEERRVAAGRRILGMRRVLQQDWRDSPRTREDMFGPEPRSAGCRWKKREQALQDAAFQTDYAEARRLARAGGRPLFPFGTWAMVRYAGYACASP